MNNRMKLLLTILLTLGVKTSLVASGFPGEDDVWETARKKKAYLTKKTPIPQQKATSKPLSSTSNRGRSAAVPRVFSTSAPVQETAARSASLKPHPLTSMHFQHTHTPSAQKIFSSGMIQITAGYPKEWDGYAPAKMFNLLKTNFIDRVFLDQWMNAIEACYQDFKEDTQHTAINFSRSIYDLAKLKKNHQTQGLIVGIEQRRSAWFKTWFEETLPLLNKFNSQALSNTVYALGQLDIIPPEDWSLTINHALVHKEGAFFLEQKHQLFLFSKFQEMSGKPSFLSEEILARWMEEFQSRATTHNQTSVSEKAVGKTLTKLRPEFEASSFIPEMVSVVDFYNAGTKNILQFDGPTHFLSDGSFNGSTAFQTRLLKHFGYCVLRLSYKDWSKRGEEALLLLLD